MRTHVLPPKAEPLPSSCRHCSSGCHHFGWVRSATSAYINSETSHNFVEHRNLQLYEYRKIRLQLSFNMALAPKFAGQLIASNVKPKALHTLELCRHSLYSKWAGNCTNCYATDLDFVCPVSKFEIILFCPI